MTICHVTPSGQMQTLNLPRGAAEAHMANHPDDFWGACPIEPPVPPETPEPAPE